MLCQWKLLVIMREVVCVVESSKEATTEARGSQSENHLPTKANHGQNPTKQYCFVA
jgi:hypothetical protein